MTSYRLYGELLEIEGEQHWLEEFETIKIWENKQGGQVTIRLYPRSDTPWTVGICPLSRATHKGAKDEALQLAMGWVRFLEGRGLSPAVSREEFSNNTEWTFRR